MTTARFNAWAIKLTSDSRLDGHREHLCGGARYNRPTMFGGCATMLFKTREAAREFIKAEYGYIAERPDLQAEPHGWKMPRAVKVQLRAVEVPA